MSLSFAKVMFVSPARIKSTFVSPSRVEVKCLPPLPVKVMFVFPSRVEVRCVTQLPVKVMFVSPSPVKVGRVSPLRVKVNFDVCITSKGHFLCPFHPRDTAVARKDSGHSAKSEGGRLHLNTQTPFTQ